MEVKDHRVRVAAERRARMREHLLLAGLRLVAAKGPDGFTIDDVVAAAEVARGTFYKYFDSPASLVQAVAVDLSQELIVTVNQLFSGAEDPAIRAATGMRAVLGWVRKAPVLGAFITRAGWPHAAPGHAFFRLVGPNLDAGIARGRFRVAHREIGLALIGGLSIGAMQSLATADLSEDFAELVAETMLKALGLDAAEARLLARLPMTLPQALPEGLISKCVVQANPPALAPPAARL